MPEISLVVTRPVINHTMHDRQNESQIAIRAATADIAPQIRQLTAGNGANLQLGGCIVLDVRDPGAIWRAHNAQQLEDFDALFNLLARRPDHEMRFLCEII
jgi:hypothetical protein